MLYENWKKLQSLRMKYFLKLLVSLSSPTQGFRRVVGAIILIIVVLMVIFGGFVFDMRAKPMLALAYWGICFIFLFLAVLIAYIDLKTIRRNYNIQKKQLLISTFDDEEFKRKLREKKRELIISEDKGDVNPRDEKNDK